MATATEHELRFSAPVDLDLTAAKSDATKPARVSIVAYSGGVMNPPGFGPTVVDLSGVTITGKTPLLADHKNELSGVVGAGVATINANRLSVDGQLSRNSEAARQIIALSQDGVEWQASIGMEITAKEFIQPGRSVTVNGRTITASQRGFTLIRGGVLREISITPNGADPGTEVSIAAARGKNMSSELNEVETQVDPHEMALQASQAERLRCARIAEECKGNHTLQAKAISEGWTPAKAALEMMKASYPSTPVLNHSAPVRDGDYLTAALALNAGCPEEIVGQSYDQRVMNSAVSAAGRRVGYHDILRAVCSAVGKHLPQGRLTASDVREAFDCDLQLRASGFSTLSIPGTLGNAAGKVLLGAYQGVPSVARQICSKASVPDFKQHTSYRLTGDGVAEELGPGGEFKSTTLSEASYTNQAKTYGKMISITRRDIINDDLNSLADVPKILGRQAALALENAVFVKLLSNENSFFSTGNLNFDDGTDSALDLAGLTAAHAAFWKQVDADGKPIMVAPRFLLTPPELFATARTLIESLELVGSTTADVLRPNANPFSKSLEPLVSPYLSNSTITGYSAKAWYLIANPSDVSMMELAYLNGIETPTVETENAAFNTLGVQMRVFHDFGVAFRDYRAAWKSKGEN